MKTKLTAILALLATAGFAGAQTEQTQAQEPIYLDMNLLSVTYGCMLDINDGLSVHTMHGGTFAVGYSFNETARTYSTAYFKTGFYAGRTTYADMCRTTFSQKLMPLMVGYTFHLKCNDTFSFYAGAEAGFLYSSTSYNTYYPADWEYNHIQDQHTKLPFSCSVDVGFTCKLSKRIEWETGVSFGSAFGIYTEQPYRTYAKTRDAVFSTIHTGFTYTF